MQMGFPMMKSANKASKGIGGILKTGLVVGLISLIVVAVLALGKGVLFPKIASSTGAEWLWPDRAGVARTSLHFSLGRI